MYFYGAKISGFPQLIPTDFRLFWYIFSSGAKKRLLGLVHIIIIIYICTAKTISNPFLFLNHYEPKIDHCL